MKLRLLPSHQECRACQLGEGCRRPGIRSRCFRVGDGSRCLLFVGQGPGWQEDNLPAPGRILVGPSGRLFSRGYLWHIPPETSVWAANATRCAPPGDFTPRATEVRLCNPHLHHDVCALLERYGDLTIVCMGAVAAKAVLGKTLTDAFNRQGTWISKLAYSPNLPRPIQVFSTYHPAYLLRTRKQTTSAVVEDHLDLVAKTLNAPIDPRRVVRMPLGDLLAAAQKPSRIWFDIETYGIRPDVVQTQFNPYASRAIDGVPIGRQIVSAALGYESDGKLLCSVFLWNEQVATTLARWFQARDHQSWTIAGTNVLFDLLFAFAEFGCVLRHITIEDLCVISFMQNPDRPEGSLGALSGLFLPEGLEFKYGAKGQKYSDDKALLEYNIGDVIQPYFIRERLWNRILEQGRPRDPNVTLRSYSDSLHVMWHMARNGLAIDRIETVKRLRRLEGRMNRMARAHLARWGVPLQGEDSGKASDQLFRDIVEACPQGPAGGWQLTKTGLISSSIANVNRAMIANLPPVLRRRARVLRRFRDLQKTVTAYLRPYERLTRNTIRLYPTWFPVPSRFESNSGDESFSGGTRQVRITAKRPAIQTAPESVKSLFRRRYRDGFLASFDYSQLEMRVAALVSGDKKLMEIYEQGRDVHQETLDHVYGRHVDPSESDYSRLRRNAKNVNFGALFGGMERAIQGQLWIKSRQWVPTEELTTFVLGFTSLYAGYVRYRWDQIRLVWTQGFDEIPVAGQWLSFSHPGRGELDKAIYNFKIQGIAAEICKQAQLAAIRWLDEQKAGCCPMNIYDAILIDSSWPLSRKEDLRHEISRRMSDGPFIRALYDHYQREVPFAVDFTLLDSAD